MANKISWLIILSLFGYIFFTFFWGNEKEYTGEPTITGYIVKADFMDILVISGITRQQALSDDLIINELSPRNGQDAIKFRAYNFFRYKPGQKVMVWADGAMTDSYPGSAGAGRIEIISEETLPFWVWIIYYGLLLYTIKTAIISLIRKTGKSVLSFITIVFAISVPIVSILNSIGRKVGLNEFDHLKIHLLLGSSWAIFVIIGYVYILVWWLLFLYSRKQKVE